METISNLRETSGSFIQKKEKIDLRHIGIQSKEFVFVIKPENNNEFIRISERHTVRALRGHLSVPANTVLKFIDVLENFRDEINISRGPTDLIITSEIFDGPESSYSINLRRNRFGVYVHMKNIAKNGNLISQLIIPSIGLREFLYIIIGICNDYAGHLQFFNWLSKPELHMIKNHEIFIGKDNDSERIWISDLKTPIHRTIVLDKEAVPGFCKAVENFYDKEKPAIGESEHKVISTPTSVAHGLFCTLM